MPRSYNEDLRFRAMRLKEYSYSIELVAATLHMSPKTIQQYVLKCLNNEQKIWHARPKSIFVMHPHEEFVLMEAVRQYQKNINYVPDYLSGLSRADKYFSAFLRQPSSK